MKGTRVRLARRPHGEPGDDTFEFFDEPVSEPGVGEVLLRSIYLSLDPYMRGYMDVAKPGDPMIGSTVCEVLASRHPDFAEGDIVASFSGWGTHHCSDGSGLEILDATAAPVSTALGVLGVPGFTAYAGLLGIGQPMDGETVVVAAAAGPVGSAVGQVAGTVGARRVGIVGGPEKVRLLREEFGFDVALDRHSPTFADEFAAAVPDGVDVYFENVGGAVSREVYRHMNEGARVPICGMVSTYNDTGDEAATDAAGRRDSFLQLVQHKRMSLRGFIHFELRPQWDTSFRRDMPQWVVDGTVRYREDIVDGLEHAPAAFRDMLAGRSLGKTIVRVGTDPTLTTTGGTA